MSNISQALKEDLASLAETSSFPCEPVAFYWLIKGAQEILRDSVPPSSLDAYSALRELDADQAKPAVRHASSALLVYLLPRKVGVFYSRENLFVVDGHLSLPRYGAYILPPITKVNGDLDISRTQLSHLGVLEEVCGDLILSARQDDEPWDLTGIKVHGAVRMYRDRFHDRKSGYGELTEWFTWPETKERLMGYEAPSRKTNLMQYSLGDSFSSIVRLARRKLYTIPPNRDAMAASRYPELTAANAEKLADRSTVIAALRVLTGGHTEVTCHGGPKLAIIVKGSLNLQGYEGRTLPGITEVHGDLDITASNITDLGRLECVYGKIILEPGRNVKHRSDVKLNWGVTNKGLTGLSGGSSPTAPGYVRYTGSVGYTGSPSIISFDSRGATGAPYTGQGSTGVLGGHLPIIMRQILTKQEVSDLIKKWWDKGYRIIPSGPTVKWDPRGNKDLFVKELGEYIGTDPGLVSYSEASFIVRNCLAITKASALVSAPVGTYAAEVLVGRALQMMRQAGAQRAEFWKETLSAVIMTAQSGELLSYLGDGLNDGTVKGNLNALTEALKNCPYSDVGRNPELSAAITNMANMKYAPYGGLFRGLLRLARHNARESSLVPTEKWDMISADMVDIMRDGLKLEEEMGLSEATPIVPVFGLGFGDKNRTSLVEAEPLPEPTWRQRLRELRKGGTTSFPWTRHKEDSIVAIFALGTKNNADLSAVRDRLNTIAPQYPSLVLSMPGLLECTKVDKLREYYLKRHGWVEESSGMLNVVHTCRGPSDVAPLKVGYIPHFSWAGGKTVLRSWMLSGAPGFLEGKVVTGLNALNLVTEDWADVQETDTLLGYLENRSVVKRSGHCSLLIDSSSITEATWDGYLDRLEYACGLLAGVFPWFAWSGSFSSIRDYRAMAIKTLEQRAGMNTGSIKPENHFDSSTLGVLQMPDDIEKSKMLCAVLSNAILGNIDRRPFVFSSTGLSRLGVSYDMVKKFHEHGSLSGLRSNRIIGGTTGTILLGASNYISYEGTYGATGAIIDSRYGLPVVCDGLELLFTTGRLADGSYPPDSPRSVLLQNMSSGATREYPYMGRLSSLEDAKIGEISYGGALVIDDDSAVLTAVHPHPSDNSLEKLPYKGKILICGKKEIVGEIKRNIENIKEENSLEDIFPPVESNLDAYLLSEPPSETCRKESNSAYIRDKRLNWEKAFFPNLQVIMSDPPTIEMSPNVFLFIHDGESAKRLPNGYVLAKNFKTRTGMILYANGTFYKDPYVYMARGFDRKYLKATLRKKRPDLWGTGRPVPTPPPPRKFTMK